MFVPKNIHQNHQNLAVFRSFLGFFGHFGDPKIPKFWVKNSLFGKNGQNGICLS